MLSQLDKLIHVMKKGFTSVVNKFSSHKEAEMADDIYWKKATAEERLEQIIQYVLFF